MKNILLNIDTQPSDEFMLDGKKIISVEDKQILGYVDNEQLIRVTEPGWYSIDNVEIDPPTFTRVDLEIGEDITQQFIDQYAPGYEPYYEEDGDWIYRRYIEVYECQCTISGTSCGYLVKNVETRENQTTGFYEEEVWFMAASSDDPLNVYYSLVHAEEGKEIFTGLFNLEGGESIRIVDVAWNGTLIDDNGEYHQYSKFIYYEEYVIPPYDEFYYEWRYTAYFTPIGDGKYRCETNRCAGDWPKTGYSINIQSTAYTCTRLSNESRTVIVTSGGTQVQITYTSSVILNDENNEEVAVAWFTKISGYTVVGYPIFTGRTFDSLTYIATPRNSPYNHEYEIEKISGRRGEKVLTRIKPGVSYRRDGRHVYFNRRCIPVYDVMAEANVFAFSGRTVTFDIYFSYFLQKYFADPSYLKISINPDDVERVYMRNSEWSGDVTEEFKNGEYDIDNFITPTWSHSIAYIVTFTEEFYKNGTLLLETEYQS